MKIFSKSSVTLTALAGIALGSFGPAYAAKEHPPLNPSKDAVVTYKVEVPVPGKGKVQLKERKISFQKNGDRIRVDEVEGTHSIIIDKSTQKVILLESQRKVWMGLQAREGSKGPFLLDLSMDFKNKGEKEIAGQKCTEWSLRSKFGAGKACVTEDGIILEQKGVDADGQHGEMTAVSVSYPQKLPLSTFQTPKGYKSWNEALEQERAAKKAAASSAKH